MFRRVILLYLAALMGCVSAEYHDVPRHDGDSPPYALKVGEVVSITTSSEHKLEFEITGISENSLRGKDVEVSYADIQTVRVKNADTAEKGSNFLYYLMATELLLVVAFVAILG